MPQMISFIIYYELQGLSVGNVFAMWVGTHGVPDQQQWQDAYAQALAALQATTAVATAPLTEPIANVLPPGLQCTGSITVRVVAEFTRPDLSPGQQDYRHYRTLDMAVPVQGTVADLYAEVLARLAMLAEASGTSLDSVEIIPPITC